MAHASETTYEAAEPASRALWDAQIKAHGRMTNMKRTLAHSPAALRALMEWYPLRDAVEPFLGPRLTTLFAHAISVETDCLICSTFFRRLLKDAGENPDHLQLDPFETVVVAYGRELAVNPNRVLETTIVALKQRLSDRQLVELTSFGALMIATNVVNSALKVNLDDYLAPYQGLAKDRTGK